MGIFSFFSSSFDPNPGFIHPCRTEADFRKLLKSSHNQPVFLFKHSTACTGSLRAWKEFLRFAEAHKHAEYYQVLVIQDRALSQKIAQDTGIPHQSPQVLLFHREKVVWADAHWGISEENLSRALQHTGEDKTA